VVVKDVGSENKEDFFFDGHYFIAPNTTIAFNEEEEADLGDVWIEHIEFLSESLIMVVTSNRNVRVLYTQKFLPGQFES
jgi:hypothetical protein